MSDNIVQFPEPEGTRHCPITKKKSTDSTLRLSATSRGRFPIASAWQKSPHS